MTRDDRTHDTLLEYPIDRRKLLALGAAAPALAAVGREAVAAPAAAQEEPQQGGH